MSWNCPLCEVNGFETPLSDGGDNITLSGTVQLMFTLDLSEFVADGDRETLDILRGSDSLSRAMHDCSRQLLPSFSPHFDENHVRPDGYRLAGFRVRFVSTWLLDTYCIHAKARRPSDPRLNRLWDRYSYTVRFSRFGSLEVKLSRNLFRLKDDAALITEAAEGPDTTNNNGWQLNTVVAIENALAYEVAARFLKEVRSLSVEHGVEALRTISFQPRPLEDPVRNARPFVRYALLLIGSARCRVCGYHLSSIDLSNYGSAFLSALMGSSYEQLQRAAGTDGHTGLILRLAGRQSGDRLRDFSPWDQDICLIGPERALIFCAQPALYVGTLDPPNTKARPFTYAQYWRCVSRIIEHTLSLRTSLYIMEVKTTSALQRLADVALTANIENDPRQDTRRITRLLTTGAVERAKLLNILPVLRGAVDPRTLVSNDATTAIMSYLVEDAFDCRTILDRAHKNLAESAEFLQYVQARIDRNEDDLHKDFERLNARTTTIFTFVAIFIVVPSFLLDLLNLLEPRVCGPESELSTNVFCTDPLVFSGGTFLLILLILSALLYSVYHSSPLGRRSGR
jgi:hypothetical protein